LKLGPTPVKHFVNPLTQLHQRFDVISDRFTFAIAISGEKTE
jgi:hypothetical protein